ncbi:root hair defective 3 GTP-binding protein-domain-containing protein [Thamnocephalis sphaerospora]|uniref:Root hair defective 3 GTP-binding protein-domain-containing protein n=1 Tax=Thamnocephalis sphaerospora TaxID=78915 RepID=A0A4P9XHU3_9FUNG|nr:root hair defective 3 GTP-binding protein-domain-containing protein [Thamnocephalis sphaerospora]|eukprot:RKP05197.1 root hair defective 3 GTP-binding protein-domain-containing protein [Thamnocephalis sphaerospora]
MAGKHLQFLDHEQQLVAGVEKLADEKWNLNDWGINYNVVAIGGQPGSGKSTLANALFGAEFPVLTEGGEQPTTKGVWISTAANSKTLVMDTEIAELNVDQSLWTSKLSSTTFTAATASVFIFNVQKSLVENDSNGIISFLLGKIYAAHLAMFGQRHKTMILFAVRNCSDETSKESLTSTLDKRIKSAWKKVKKPNGLENSAVDDIFDYDVITLPSKIASPNEFDTAVDKLRGRYDAIYIR